MTLIKRYIAVCFFGIALLTSSVAYGAENSDLVLVSFGTDKLPKNKILGRNGGKFVKQAPTGALFVAGYAQSRLSDTGGIPPKPMLAMFDSDGTKRWEKIYDRTGWSILDISVSDSKPAVLLGYPEPNDWYRLDEEHESYSSHGLVELWTLATEGELGEEQLTLEHSASRMIASSDDTGFTLLLAEMVMDSALGQFEIQHKQFDWTGKQLGPSGKFGAESSHPLIVDHHGVLVSNGLDGETGAKALRHYSFDTGDSKILLVDDCNRCDIHSAIRNADRVELLLTEGDYKHPDRSVQLRTYQLSTGRNTSRVELDDLNELDTLTTSTGRNGDLLIVGTDLYAHTLARLSAETRKIVSAQRFQLNSVRRTGLSSAFELTDGRLAITGSTGNETGMNQAIFLMTDAHGESLKSLTSCVSDGFDLTRVTNQLRRQYRLKLETRPNHYWSDKNSLTMRPNDGGLVHTCENNHELNVLRFGSELLRHLPDLSGKYATTVNLMTLQPLLSTKRNAPYYYVADNSDVHSLPALLVNLDSAKEVAAEVEHSVLPYLAELDKFPENFYQQTRQFFRNGDSLQQYRDSFLPSEQHKALSPRDYANALSVLFQTYNQLSEDEKAEVFHARERYYFVHLLPGSGATRKNPVNGVHLPVTNAGQFWNWTRQGTKQYATEIQFAEDRFTQHLNIEIVQRPSGEPEKYLNFLNELYPLVSHLQKGAHPVRMAYTPSTTGYSQKLSIWKVGHCTSHAQAGFRAQYVADWLENLWDCQASKSSQGRKP